MNCLKTKYTFWLYKSKLNNVGQSPVYMRIIVGKKHTELATGIYIFEKNWNDKTGRIKGQQIPDIDILNLKLESLDKAFHQVLKSFIEADIAYTPLSFKKRLKGSDADIKSLVELFTDHNKGMEELIGIDYSESTCQRYATTFSHVREFLKVKLKQAKAVICRCNVPYISGGICTLTEHKSTRMIAKIKSKNIRLRIISIDPHRLFMILRVITPPAFKDHPRPTQLAISSTFIPPVL